VVRRPGTRVHHARSPRARAKAWGGHEGPVELELVQGQVPQVSTTVGRDDSHRPPDLLAGTDLVLRFELHEPEEPGTYLVVG
jgi:hypothetical protein